MTLKEDIESDREIFKDTEEFADAFVFSLTGATVAGRFDNAFIEAEDVESTALGIVLDVADVPGIVHGNTLTHVDTSMVYKVIGVQPDGHGWVMVLISRD